MQIKNKTGDVEFGQKSDGPIGINPKDGKDGCDVCDMLIAKCKNFLSQKTSEGRGKGTKGGQVK